MFGVCLGRNRCPPPCFCPQDMQRIASSGPQFGDLVLEHVESSPPLADETGAPVASAHSYNYIPFTVLGDYQYEPEPNWLELGTMSAPLFYEGLAQRNWTSSSYR